MAASEMKDISADDADAEIAYETRLPVNASAVPENQRKMSPLGVDEGGEGKTSMVHALPTPTVNCSPSSGAIERSQRTRNENKASPMMMEFLRSRLSSERGVSRAAREHVEQLAGKIQELECQLELEVQLRKQAEATKLEVFSKYKEFFTDESYDLVALNSKEAHNCMITACEEDEDSRRSDTNNNLNIEGEDVQSSVQETSIECSIVPHTEKQGEEIKQDTEPTLQKGVLMWETQRKNRDNDKKQALDRSSHGLSRGRALVRKMPVARSAEGDTFQKKWKGKSVRQIKKRDSRLVAEEESNMAEDSGALSGSDGKETNQQLDPNGDADLNNFLEMERTQDSPESQDSKDMESFDETKRGELGQISALPDVNVSTLCKAKPVHEMQENNELSKKDGMQNDRNSQNDSPESQDSKDMESFDETKRGELGQISELPDVNVSTLRKARPVHEMQENNELSKKDGMQNDRNSQNDSPESQDSKDMESFDETKRGELGQISELPDVNVSTLRKARPVHEMQENNELSKKDGMQNDSNSQNDVCSNGNFTVGDSEGSLTCLDSLDVCDPSDPSGSETLALTTQRDVAIDGIEEKPTEKSKQPELVSDTLRHARSNSISHTEEHLSQTRLTKMSPPGRHVSSKSLDTDLPWENANIERGMGAEDIKVICKDIPEHAGFDWVSQRNDEWDREISGSLGQPSFPLRSTQYRNLSRSTNHRTLGLERVGEVLEALAQVKEQVQGFSKLTDTWASMGTHLPRIGRPFGGPFSYTTPSRSYTNRQVGPNIISSVGMEFSLTSPKHENS